MGEREFWRSFCLGVAIAFILASLIVIVVFSTGSTFGQRCRKMYPAGTGMQMERCVEMLSHGVNPAMTEAQP